MRWLIGLLIIALSSCLSKPKNKVSVYFSIDSLISAQQHQLIRLNSQINKISIVDGDTSKVNFKADSVQWRDELGVFGVLDINKPVLDGLYSINTEKDKHSNLMIKTYIPADSDKLEVKFLKLYYLKDISDIRKIEGKYVHSTPVYSSEKIAKLTFEKRNDRSYLTEYGIVSNQTMKTQDDFSYIMKSIVSYKD